MRDAGGFMHRVHIQERVNTQDATTGENIISWSAVYSDVPCAINAVSVREYLESQADQSEVTARIVMRVINGFNYTADLRLVGACGCHDGRVYNPRGWLEDKESAQEYITAPCSEGINEG